MIATRELRPGKYNSDDERRVIEILEFRGPEINVSPQTPFVVRYRIIRDGREGLIIQDRFTGDESWGMIPVHYVIDEVPA